MERFRKLLCVAASKSVMRQNHAALLAKGDKVIAIGCNKFLSYGRKSIHAEEIVLRKIPRNYDRRDLTLYVIRINRRGKFVYSFPCKRCQILIKRAGIRYIYYSVNGE